MGEDFNNHLRIITSSGERTRGILYLFGLMVAALFGVVWESDIFNWTEIRHEKISKAYLCYTHGLAGIEKVPVVNPTDKDTCQSYYDYVGNNYFIVLTPPEFTSKHPYSQTWDALSERYKLLTKEYIEGAEITIPVLAIKVDRGNVFFFATIAFMMILMTLRLSMMNESQCIIDVMPMITNRRRATSVANCHVFGRARKHSFNFWWFLFAPSIIILIDVIQNGMQFAKTKFILDLGWLGVFYLIQVCTTILMIYVNLLCFWAASYLDDQIIALTDKPESSMDDD